MKRLILASFLVLSACGGGSGNTPSESDIAKAPVEPPMECLPGCRMQLSLCSTEATVLEGVRETIKQIECDPRCCDGQPVTVSAVDGDADGIPDDADQCPAEPEDRDGFKDDDGCPEADNDEDGILDALDVCPLDKEDFDGFQDEDGCPD